MAEEFPYTLTAHAAKVIAERQIPLAWVGRVLALPRQTEPDKQFHVLRSHRVPGFSSWNLRKLVPLAVLRAKHQPDGFLDREENADRREAQFGVPGGVL